jgi:hypothetical protein
VPPAFPLLNLACHTSTRDASAMGRSDVCHADVGVEAAIECVVDANVVTRNKGVGAHAAQQGMVANARKPGVVAGSS